MATTRRFDPTPAWICLAYAVTTTAWYAIWRDRFAERSADEAIFENLLWNAIHGSGLRCWIEGGVHHLAVHFSPILYLLIPFYGLGGMMAIHALVAVTTAAAGLAIHRYATPRLDGRSALAVMLAFMLNPTIVLQTFMEMHEQALATLPLVMLFMAWSESKPARAALWAALLLSIREDNALLVLALGVFALFTGSGRRMGVTLIVLGIAWLSAWWAIAFRVLGAGHLPGVFAGTYGVWGDTPSAALAFAARHPGAVVSHVLSPVPLRYLAQLLAPFLFVLPFGSAISLTVLPQVLQVLLANHETRMFEIRMHYSIVPVIGLLFGAMATLERLGNAPARGATWTRRWAPLLMAGVALALAPVWAVRAAGRLNPFTPQIREMLVTVPDTASVTAPGYLLNHLARRREIGMEGNENFARTECVVLEDHSRSFFEGRRVDIFYSPRLDSALVAAGYEKTYQRDGWYVFRRGDRH